MKDMLNRREALERLAMIALATSCSQTKAPQDNPADSNADAGQDAANVDGAVADTSSSDSMNVDSVMADTASGDSGSDKDIAADSLAQDTSSKPCSTQPDEKGPGAPPDQCPKTGADVEGPYYEPNAPNTVVLTDSSEPGERLTLSGRIFNDSCSSAVGGMKIEVWHADTKGEYRNLSAPTPLRATLKSDCSGYFSIETILPGAYLDAGGYRPRHLHFRFTPANGPAVVTQMYFADDPYLSPNDSCGICKSDDATLIVALKTVTKLGKKHHAGHFKVVV
ncbi:MAG TPA: hypothetical protein DCQ06_12430 [Myxococcales bacterium]|nr:hypothetical protein [Myxococcales bacterium]HAN32393.1 hypothetical protein [Myxococcales bacterium]